MTRPRCLNVSWGAGSSSMDRERAEGRRRRRGQRFALEDLESRCLLTSVTAYPLPGDYPSPQEITVAGGKVWFTEPGLGLNGAIGMIDPADTAHPQSFSTGITSAPSGITTGPDNNVWFTEPATGKIGMLSVSNPAHPIQSFSLPGSPTPVPAAITAGFDSHGHPVLWYTDPTNNAIGMIDPSNTGSPPAEIKLPSTLVGLGHGLAAETQIVAGPGGKLWFTEVKFDPSTFAITASAIGSYNPATAAWSEVALNLSPSGAKQGPFGLTLGPDNNIWFGEAVQNLTGSGSAYLSSALGMINLSVSPPAITKDVAIPTPSGGVTPLPYQLVSGPDGAIWFTDNSNPAVVAFDPTSKAFTPLNAPKATAFSAVPYGITAGLGSTWFIDNGGAVDVVTPDTQVAVTVQPPSEVHVGDPINVTASVTYADTGKGYNGSATISLATNPGGATLGGTLTVPVTNGVATFSGLTLNQLGSGYTLKVTSGTTPTTTLTTSITVTSSSSQPPPTSVPPAEITGQSVLFAQKTNKKGKKVGKPVLTGFQINFNTAMNAASTGNQVNYTLGTNIQVKKRVGRKTVTVLQVKPIAFSVSYNASNHSVSLLLTGKQAFLKGGQITLLGAISSSAGGSLDGNSDGTGGDNAVFNISPNARTISHA